MLEDMNVKARENGKKMDISAGIDAEIHGSLDGVNAKRENSKHSNGIEYIFENGKCPNGMSQFDKNVVGNDGNEVKEDEEKTQFLCNFVWGKIKDNPWWPGQIYSPSNASDYAKQLQKSDKLLVAFFGDGTFSWCSKSQLKPFLENFNNMSKQNNSKKLKHAIEEALDEIGRIVEFKMGNRSAFDRPLVVNAGIRQGVLVPEYDISEIPCFEPVKIMSLVKNIAKNPFVSCMLELTVLKSLLSAVNRPKRKNEPTMFLDGFGELYQPWLRKCEKDCRDKFSPMYHKQMQSELASLSTKIGGGKSKLVSDKENIESVTEKVDKITIGETEKIDASMVKRVTRSSNRDSTGKGVYQVREDLASPLESTTRKRKMNEMFDEIMEKKGNAENGSKKKTTRLKNEERKENENVLAKDNEFGTEKVDKTTQRETENVAVSSNKELGTEKLDKFTKRGNEKIAVSKDKESGTDKADKFTKTGTENLAPDHRDEKLLSLSQMTTRKRKNNDSSEFPEIKDEKKSAKMESNDKVFGDQDTGKALELWERKKSMYLSPSFISLHPKKARMGERLNKVAGQVIGSILNLDSNNKPSQNNTCKEIDTSNYTSPKEGKEIVNEPFQDNISKEVVISMKAPLEEKERKIIDSVRINLSMQKVVSEIRSAALNPLVLWNKNFLEMVEGFISAYRNVEYVCGSNYKIYNNVGKKCNSVKTGSKLVKANDKNIGEEAFKPVSLLVIFPPGFCLPSKTHLIKIFSEFGGVNEMETDVSDDCHCGKIVFLSCSDTEKAFNTCLQKSPFGSAKVSYRLRYSTGSKKGNEIVKIPDKLWASAEFEESCFLFLKQKLEIMTSMVDNCYGKLSSEFMVALEKEMKGVLDNISSITKNIPA